MKSATNSASQAAALAALGENLDTAAPVDTPSRGNKLKAKLPARVRIILEENDGIPPSGQFFQIGGTDESGTRFLRSYGLRPGEEAEVPVELLEVLNNAVMAVPVKDAQDTVIGYRDKLRFPYRVLQPGSSARA